jgi:hypothetical protein
VPGLQASENKKDGVAKTRQLLRCCDCLWRFLLSHPIGWFLQRHKKTGTSLSVNENAGLLDRKLKIAISVSGESNSAVITEELHTGGAHDIQGRLSPGGGHRSTGRDNDPDVKSRADAIEGGCAHTDIQRQTGNPQPLDAIPAQLFGKPGLVENG